MKKVIVSFVLLCSCSRVGVERGARAVQLGLASVDTGVRVASSEYARAVEFLRAFCGGDEKCEERYNVRDSDVARVRAHLETIARGYDTVARELPSLVDAAAVFESAARTTIERAERLR